MPQADLRSEPLLRAVPEEDGRKVLGAVVLSTKIGEDERRAIYRGRHTRLGLDVAVECYEAPRGVEGRELLERLRRSAQIACSVVHPNLRRVIDVGARYGLAYLVLEYVPGDTVRARVEALGPRPSGEAATIVLHAARGVAAAHAEGRAHGSIGPYGVRLTPDGKVKVADLGFARRLPLHPDQDVEKQPLSADVVALGALLAYLVTGRALPMAEESRLRAENPEAPGWLIELVERCLGGGEGQRPADAGALVREIEAELGRESALADPRAAPIEPLQTKGLAERRRFEQVEAERAARAERQRAEARREAPRPRPEREAGAAAFGESDLPELLSPRHAQPLVPPKGRARVALGAEALATTRALPGGGARPVSRAVAASQALAESARSSRRPSRAPWWNPFSPSAGRRRRRVAIVAALCFGGAALAAIPLWRAWEGQAAGREAEASVAFDALLGRLRRAELELAAGTDPWKAWGTLDEIKRDAARWTGAPEKRRLVDLRLEEIAAPLRKTLLEREAKALEARLEAAELGSAAVPMPVGSRQLLGRRTIELSFARSSLLSAVELVAEGGPRKQSVAAEAAVLRGERLVARLELPEDGAYELRLTRRGDGWGEQVHGFVVDVDTQPPVIALEEPREGAPLELSPGARIPVRGTVGDPSGVQSVALRWRTARGQELALPATLEGGRYQAEFEPQPFESGRFELWVLAEDRRGNRSRLVRGFAVLAKPAAQDPGARKEAPQLELSGPASSARPRPEPKAEPEVAAARPALAPGTTELAPAAPAPLGPSSPATAGDRAAPAGGRPAVPQPARESSVAAAPRIEIPLPRPSEASAPAESGGEVREELALEGPRTPPAAGVAGEDAAHATRTAPAPAPAPTEKDAPLAPETAPAVELARPELGAAPEAPPGERPELAPPVRELGGVKLRELALPPPEAGGARFDLGFLRHCEELPEGAERDEASGLPKRLTLRELGLEFCLVLPPPEGEFLMGAYPNVSGVVEVARGDRPRKVALAEPFYLGVHEVREIDWERVMGGVGTRARYEAPSAEPAGNLSFADAQLFVERANAKLGAAGLLELPDEVRWEYAARGPALALFPWGNEPDASRAQLQASAFAPAGSFAAGRSTHCGALDLAGNAKEWCRGRMSDGREEKPVLRGGSYLDPLRLASTFHREQPALDGAQPQFGCRVMLRVRRAD